MQRDGGKLHEALVNQHVAAFEARCIKMQQQEQVMHQSGTTMRGCGGGLVCATMLCCSLHGIMKVWRMSDSLCCCTTR